jgi:Family of unknown function (DUF6187)
MPAPADDYDTRFSLPGIDDPPSTEVGVILMGLDTERLVAGLGAAEPDEDDPAKLTLIADQLRHGVRPGLDAALAEGALRWRWARAALARSDPTGPPSTAIRSQWTYATRAVAAAPAGTLGLAALCFLAACWLRRADVDRYIEERNVLPDRTS